MNILSKKCVFLLNVIVGCIIFILVSSRFQQDDIVTFQVKKFAGSEIEVTSTSLKIPTTAAKVKVPWRFQIEEDGFYFPAAGGAEQTKERYIAYEPVNASWPEQILQFENACAIAYLLKRTLLVPPLMHFLPEIKYSKPSKLNTVSPTKHSGGDNSVSTIKHSGGESTTQDYTKRGGEPVPLFTIIDSELLSKKVKVLQLDEIKATKVKYMTKYFACLDSRLGFWLDYIPSVENIQTWRLLRQIGKNFKTIDVNVLKDDARCPETVFGKWTYPKNTKLVYRGVLTEFHHRTEEVIYFHAQTLADTYLRIFDKQRTTDLQNLLLVYFKFTPAIKSRIKILANLIDPNKYTAVDFNVFNKTEVDADAITFVENELVRLGATAEEGPKTILAVSISSYPAIYQRLTHLGYRVIFAKEFIEENIKLLDGNTSSDKTHLLSLLLCAYASNFIAVNTTTDVYFVRHLRTEELFTANGVVTNDINVRWAKHTTKENAIAFHKKKLERENSRIQKQRNNTSQTVINSTDQLHYVKFRIPQNATLGRGKVNLTRVNPVNKPLLTKLEKSPHPVKRVVKKTKDQLTSMVCIFCNYIRHITGQHGCPTMKDIC